MKNTRIKILIVLTLAVIIFCFAMPVFAETASSAAQPDSQQTAAIQDSQNEASLSGSKAIAAGIAITFAAGLGALGMGVATGKCAEGISRQPEAENKIRTTFMLGLVFIETAIIYALLVVILIIFVI